MSAAPGEPFFAPAVDLEPAVVRPRYVAPPWMRVPLEFVPSSLSLVRLIGITDDDLAIVLDHVEVFPTGIRFELHVLPQPGNDLAEDAAAWNGLYPEAAGYGDAHLDRRLRVGALWADGRTASNLFLHGPERSDDEPPAVLRVDGGSGSSRGVSSEHWVWPIPAEGDLTLLFAWTSRGLEEQLVVLDGDDLRAAAATSAARAIWPGAQLPPPTRADDLD